MIFSGTLLDLNDNCGVKWVKCIKVLHRRPRKWGKIGDIIIVSIQSVKEFSKVKRKEIQKGLIIRLKKNISREDGSMLKFSKNSVVILNNKHNPICNRLFGPVARELRIKNNAKLMSLCRKVL